MAIAIFDDIEKMLNAYHELVGANLNQTDIYIVGQQGSLIEVLSNDFWFEIKSSEPNTTALKWSNKYKSGTTKIADVASKDGAASLENLFNFKSWMAGKLYKNLEKHLAEGHCLIVVYGLTLLSEQLVFQTLTPFAIDGIQFHDY